jgi:hypothetical protein
MFHSAGIKTSLIDAVYDRTNFRSEFRFDVDKVYLSNARLLNVGVVKVGGDASSYNKLVGSYGVIKQISLMDGNETLSNMVDFNRYTAFKSFVKKNDENNSIKKFLQKNDMGFVFNDTATNTRLEGLEDTTAIQTTEVATGKGWLSLRECIPFLSASQYVPTNVFRNLRLVIEYDTQVSSFASNDTLSYNTLEPLLVCDMMVNSKVATQMMMEYKGLSWVDVETDRMVLPEIFPVPNETTPNPQQQTSFLVNGFNGKSCNRMVLCNVPTGILTYKEGNFYTLYSNMGSMNQYQQSVQVQLNGSNLFTEPINTPNKRLASLVDNYGDATMPLGYGTYDGLTDLVENPLEVLGNTDYTCFSLGGARVQELVIEYSRVGVYDADLVEAQGLGRFNQRLTLQLFGEVQKRLVMNGKGQYVIAYA